MPHFDIEARICHLEQAIVILQRRHRWWHARLQEDGARGALTEGAELLLIGSYPLAKRGNAAHERFLQDQHRGGYAERL